MLLNYNEVHVIKRELSPAYYDVMINGKVYYRKSASETIGILTKCFDDNDYYPYPYTIWTTNVLDMTITIEFTRTSCKLSLRRDGMSTIRYNAYTEEDFINYLQLIYLDATAYHKYKYAGGNQLWRSRR